MSPHPPTLRDDATGISLRFVREFDATKDLQFHPNAFSFVWPTYAGRLTDDGWYPSRVCSGRERSAE